MVLFYLFLGLSQPILEFYSTKVSFMCYQQRTYCESYLYEVTSLLLLHTFIYFFVQQSTFDMSSFLSDFTLKKCIALRTALL